VTYNNRTSAPQLVTVSKTAIGLYSSNGVGTGPALATDLNYQPVGPLSSAKPGQGLILWATGAGPVAIDETVPALLNPQNLETNINAQIYIGGQMVSPIFVGRASCCTGLDQINFQLPLDVSTGCAVPVAVQAGNVVSNFVTIPVAPSGGTCSDSSGFSGDDLAKLQAQGHESSSSSGTVSTSGKKLIRPQ
jgi:uncharacterized protein (TIGR03437 family)